MLAPEIKAILRMQLQNCAGWQSDAISQDRVDALNYYLQRARGDEVNGRSTVVAGDISASVEANLAQMVQSFSSARIVEFDSLDAGDEDQSQLETDAVTYFVMKKQNGFLQLAAAIKDCLMLRNGVTKCWLETFTETQTRTFDNVKPAAKVGLLERFPGSKVVSYKKGTLVLRLEIEHRRFRCESIPIENFLYIRDWHSFDLQEIPFCAERHVDTRSDMIRLYNFPKSKVDRLPQYVVDANNKASQARNVRSQVPVVTSTPDKSTDRVEWYECYALIDVDGDGIAERRSIAYVDTPAGTVLSNEPCDIVPYAMGAAVIMPHRATGISQYDKLRQTQDEHTGLKRALYDNVNTVTKNRLVYLDGKVNANDVGDGRPNGAIRAKKVMDVRSAVMPLTVPDNSANILQNIEALKRERTELGGAALELQSGNMQIGGERMGSMGLDRAYSVMEQLAAMMTKFVAESLIRNTFILAHAVMRRTMVGAVPIKRNGKWESADPSKWRRRDCVTVRPGMSPGQRARKAQTLRTALGDQVEFAKLGMEDTLVSVQGFYLLTMDWLRLEDIENPERYYIDPSTPEAQKSFKLKQQAAQQQDQQRQALMSMAIGLEQMKLALDKYRADQKTQWEYWNSVLNSQVAEAKIVGEATTKLLAALDTPAPDLTPPADSEKKAA